MSTIQTTEGVTGAEIHPEIPMPHWATERYLDDDGREVCDERDMQHGKFDIELAQMHSLTEAGIERHDENVCLWWDSVWADGTGKDREQFTVLVPDIPGLIEALQAAQSAAEAPRAVRRSADVENALRERDV